MKVKIITSGVYSDYCVRAIMDWISSITPAEAMAEYLREHPEQTGTYQFDAYKFCAWLVGKGYAVDLEADELHLGDYGTVELTESPFRRGRP